MSDALTLVVLLVAADPSGADGRVIEAAATDALGVDTVVVVRGVLRVPEDHEALTLARERSADAVAEIVWLDPEHRRANVHLLFTHDGRGVEREIGFSSTDAETEKGRTLGFAVASMLPEHRVAASSVPDTSVAQPEPPAPREETSRPVAAARAWVGAIDASAVFAASIGGAGAGYGGRVAGEWYFAPHFALRASATLRTSEAESAEATASFFGTGIGAGWRLLDPTRARPFGLGARADFLVMRESLTHTVPATGARESQARWLPGADLLVEGSWSFVDGAAILAAFGPEARFGATDVFLRNTQVATLVPISLLFEGGLRARF